VAQYLSFRSEDGPADGSSDDDLGILVEIDDREVETPVGVEKAGIFGRRPDGAAAIAVARTTFSAAVRGVVRENALALTRAVAELEHPPEEVELSFVLKATGEAGNIAVGKLGGEANYSVRLVWKGPERFLGGIGLESTSDPTADGAGEP
jgi:hypothetical protein